jgi:putative SOS response-associated peptidase YedK
MTAAELDIACLQRKNAPMCTRYISPEDREVEDFWRIGARTREGWVRDMRPLYMGPFIRRMSDGANELVVGQWGLIPPGCKEHIPKNKDGKRLSTSNARGEEVHWKLGYRDAWKKGQRCIIPASSFFEPNWESGVHIPWRFKRADGALWGLAGIWNVWIDPQTGEWWESYSMMTLNADAHPLMSRLHKPVVDPKTKIALPLAHQDKRSVIPLEAHEFELWLAGTVEEAKTLLKLTPVEVFDAGPIVA